MKYENYVSLIKGLEAYARENRRGYELRVMGLAALGYGYFLFLILLALSIPAIFIIGMIMVPSQILRILWLAAKLWWILLPALGAFFGFVGGAIKALFTSVPEPEGLRLKQSDAPELFRFVAETCSTLKASRPKEIILTDEFNAAVATLPRFGMFGRRVYLLLGLPLMHVLSTDQFKAVVSHEIGHISEKHGSFAKWTYQLHEAWGRLIQSQELNDHKFAALYQKFVEWFFPKFSAYSFVLMREHEKDADRHAVELVGKQSLGEALITLETRGGRIDSVFWKAIHDENVKGGPVPTALFTRMLSSIAVEDAEVDRTNLTKAMQVPTDYQDSHPSLADRLKLMGFWSGDQIPEAPALPEATAAEFFLGATAQTHIANFNAKWDESVAREWNTRYEGFQKGGERIAELDAKASSDVLTVEEMIEKAALISEKDGGLAALPFVRETVAAYPDHPEANYVLGALMVSNDDEEGMEYLHRAMELDNMWTHAASSLAFQYFRGKGRLDEAARYAAAIENQDEVIRKAEAERQSVTAQDDFEPHSLPAESIETIISKMKFDNEILAMYLVRKKVEHFKELPLNVLCFDVAKPKRLSRNKGLSGAEIVNAAVERLADIEVGFFLSLDGSNAAIKDKVERIPNAKIFDRSEADI